MMDRQDRFSPKLWHGAVLVLGLFVLGVVPLLTTFSSRANSLDTDKTPGTVSLADEGASNSSPLEESPAESAYPSAGTLDCPSTDLRVLVIAADGEESTLPSIRETLDFLGTPYSVYLAAENPDGLTSDRLSDGCRGFYTGIILTTGDLSYSADGGSPTSALTQEERQALEDYEAEFDVRRAAWYAYPRAEYGLQYPQGVNTTEEPIQAQFTKSGQKTFSYLNTQESLTIRGAFAYLARPVDEDTTPLLTDEEGNALAAVRRHPGGRETLALTFDSAPQLLHTKVIGYGVVNWVTKGLFLGDRRVYMSAQVDDIFLPNLLATGDEYRITDEDLQVILDWQRDRQGEPTTEELRLDMAFNAYGTTGLYVPDTLTSAAQESLDEFKWISHTYRHLDLDDVGYPAAISEIRDNDEWAERTGLEPYSLESLITPEHSGLANPEVIDAAYDAGVRYLVSDTSDEGYDSPSPNAGIYHPLQPSVLMIPRYASNLFFDVSTPEEWVDEYNERYRDTWGRDLSYKEILDKESDLLLSYLLEGNMNPLMFHQANLRAYDGERTLITVLLERTFAKYDRLYSLPILSPTMDELGRRMADRMRYNEAGVTASVVPGEEIQLTAQEDARVPVTGLRTGEDIELYGRQYTSYVDLEAGESVILPLR